MKVLITHARARKVLIHVQSILKASRARQSTEVSGTKSFKDPTTNTPITATKCA